MKKNLIVLALAGVAILAGTSKTNAQSLSTENSLEYQKDLIGEQNSISPKAKRGFVRNYGDANGESWTQLKDGFSARFNSNGIKNTVLYDKKGNWNGSIKSYSEDKLQHGIRHIVKSNYYDYSIINIQEIETPNSGRVPTYVISLENKAQIKFLRIYGGDMEVWKEYNKTF